MTIETSGSRIFRVSLSDPSMRFSFVVPFHSDLGCLDRCLTALRPLPLDSEVIVAADAPPDDCRSLAEAYGARVIALESRSGPAVARNAAAACASGDVLVF